MILTSLRTHHVSATVGSAEVAVFLAVTTIIDLIFSKEIVNLVMKDISIEVSTNEDTSKHVLVLIPIDRHDFQISDCLFL